jgi:hypothetical protein
MIPPSPRGQANKSEQQVFTALQAIIDKPEWTVIHSLTLTDNLATISGEADFLVLVPGKGIVVIEAKSPNYVEYKDGDWYLDKTPKPDKSPIEQLKKATASVHRFLENRDLYNDVPIARLLWFTSLSRFQFENKSPGDMQFFEWELSWQEDLEKPARTIEKVLDEYIASHKDRELLELRPAEFGLDICDKVAKSLINDFSIYRTPESRAVEKKRELSRILEEQLTLLDIFFDNEHVYLDGAAGTGKSFLLLEAARRLSKQGTKTLLACWNVMMAEELRREIGPRPNVDVFDLNTLMLGLYGIQANPKHAKSNWYDQQLPQHALTALLAKPELGDYEAILIDEFQDIAGNRTILELLVELTKNKSPEGSRFIFAGDKNQQILADFDHVSNPYDVIKAAIPDFVHITLRTNCRNAPALTAKIFDATGLTIDIKRHRLPEGTDGGIDVVTSKNGKETKTLAEVLRLLLSTYLPSEIRVLSPFGINSSLVGELFARESQSADERWLKTVLRDPNGNSGAIRWRSIPKFKGLEADVVVITDINQRAVEFAQENRKSLSELLYVGISRAKYRCVVLAAEGMYEAWA